MGLTGAGRVAVGAVVGGLLASCGTFTEAAGTRETDRQAKTLADAISYPRQESAAGFARAALATNLGRNPGFSVLEARELEAKELTDPLAHLVIRIHQEAGSGPYDKPLTACYSMDFNYYGIIDEPSRVNCPDDSTPITPPAVPRKEIPPGYDAALQSILAALPANPSQPEVMEALHKGLPAPPVDPQTQLAGAAPQVDAAVNGANVGVSARSIEAGHVDCLLGSRVNGEVLVWRPPGVTVQPGETSCDPESALARLATRSPH
jgi:hypothetical protein